MDIAGFKEITSKFDGFCQGCNEPVKQGDKVMYNPKLKGVYHKACLTPKEAPVSSLKEVTPALIKNLEKMAEAAGKKLIDRIGLDGLESVDQISPKYAEELLAEFAKILDTRKE